MTCHVAHYRIRRVTIATLGSIQGAFEPFRSVDKSSGVPVPTQENIFPDKISVLQKCQVEAVVLIEKRNYDITSSSVPASWFLSFD
jgi:hypothetical protein